MANFTLRKISADDAGILADICKKTGLHSWSEDAFVRESENPIAYYVIAEWDEKPVGFAGIWCVVDEAQVMNVGVIPEYHQRGYGFQLMEALCDHGKKVGCTTITLEVKAGNTAALALYAKCGFIQTGLRKDYYPDHSDGILMAKDLTITEKEAKNER